MWREFVEFAEKRQEPFSAICARFGVSRKTGYKWLNRFRAKGAAGLVEQSRRPKTSPRKTPEAVEDQVLTLRSEHPEWSAARISAELQALGIIPLPAQSTIDLILRRRREGAVPPALQPGDESEAQRTEPNFRWRLRFCAEVKISGVGAMLPVLIEDEATRFIVATFLLPLKRKDETLKDTLESLFRRLGMPARMGFPPPCAHTIVTVWLMTLGIGVDFREQVERDGTPRSDLDLRLANLPAYQRIALEMRTARNPFSDLAHLHELSEKQVGAHLDRLRDLHNFGGTHAATARRSPISSYRPSALTLPDERQEVSFPPEAQVRRVSEKGILTFQRRLILVGRVFAGMEIGLKPDAQAGHFVILLGGHVLGHIDLSAAEIDETTSIPVVLL